MSSQSSKYGPLLLPLAALLLPGHGVETVRAQARSAIPAHPHVIAEATFPDDATSVMWPILPLVVNGQTVRVILDVGTTTSWLNAGSLQQHGITIPFDSVLLGTTVVSNALFNVAPGSSEPGLDGLVGTPFLSHYDLVFDGPRGAVRLYAQPAMPTVGHPRWLPDGVTAADCVPMQADPQENNRVFFRLEANGHVIHSMFDSGSETTNLNVAAARVLGLHSTDSNVHLLPRGLGGQFSRFNGQQIWRVAAAKITVGRQNIVTPINIYEHLPRETSPDDPELSLGLNAVRDRVLYVSYSTRTVCFGGREARTAVVPQGATSNGEAALEPVLTAEQVTHYIAVKQALALYWQAPTHAALLQRAQATARTHVTPLDEYRPNVGVFDYVALVAQDTALAALFTTNCFPASQFAPTQVAVAHALRTLMYDEAMGHSLPDAATALGKNVAVVMAQRPALESLGLGPPRERSPPPTW
jgi:hypothetical protein